MGIKFHDIYWWEVENRIRFGKIVMCVMKDLEHIVNLNQASVSEYYKILTDAEKTDGLYHFYVKEYIKGESE